MAGAAANPLLATRIFQIQQLAHAPYRLARQAALQNHCNLQAALGVLGHGGTGPIEPLSVRLDRICGVRPRADMPRMRGGMKRRRSPPISPLHLTSPLPSASGGDAAHHVPRVSRSIDLCTPSPEVGGDAPSSPSLPAVPPVPSSWAACDLMMRCHNELHWYSVDLPTSGSVLHSLAQATILQARTPASVLRLTDEDSGRQVHNTADLIHSLEETGVIAVESVSAAEPRRPPDAPPSPLTPAHVAGDDRNDDVAVAPPAAALIAQRPATLSTNAERAARYWTSAREAAHYYASKFYEREILVASGRCSTASLAERLLATFLQLPSQPPRGPEHFGLSLQDLYTEEILLLEARARDLHSSRSSVSDACATPLDSVGLCPFPLAVACVLVSAADIAPEFLLGFYYSLAGWACHENLHAVFDPIKSDRRTCPRCMVQGICDSAAGKSPFWRGFVSPWFVGVDTEPSVLQTHAHLWPDGGPKGLYPAQATDADLAERMMETSGKLFWASPECWLLLDTAHAKKGASPDQQKVNFHYLLECQNGSDYGPRSIKSRKQQIHVPTTNFGMLLLGQADAVHDFWGQVFSPGSPVRNKGFEGRPLFLFAGAARLTHQEQLISAELIYAFLKAVLLAIASAVGHKVNTAFIRHPMLPQQAALWRELKRAAGSVEQEAPSACQVAAAKWGYSCGTHIIASHLFQRGFEALPRCIHGLEGFLQGTEPLPPAALEDWLHIQPSAFLHAPRILSHTMSSMSTIFNEMRLPIEQRAGTRAVAVPGAPTEGPSLNAQETVLAKVLQRLKHKKFLTVTDVKGHLSSKLRNQQEFERIFQLAQGLGFGQIEGVYPGSRSSPYRLRLTLATVQPEVRNRFGLEADIGHLCDADGPPMRGAGLATCPRIIVPSMCGGGKSSSARDSAAKHKARRCPAPKLSSRPALASSAAPQASAAASKKRPAAALQANRQEDEPSSARADLCKPISMAGGCDATKAECAINAVLARGGEHVHDKPFNIRCTPVKRKRAAAAFQLRCNNCQHGTCTWRGSASYDEISKLLHAFQFKRGVHGSAKSTTKRGRRAEGQPSRSFPERETLKYSGRRNQAKLQSFVAKHFENLPEPHCLCLTFQTRKHRKGAIAKCRFQCTKHWNRETQATCSWQGTATLLPPSGKVKTCTVQLQYEAPDAHAPHEYRKYGTLSFRQRQIAAKSQSKKTSDVAEKLSQQKDSDEHVELASPPKPKQLDGFMRRVRAKLRAKEADAEVPPQQAKKYEPADFEFLQGRLNAGLADTVDIPSNHSALRPGDEHLRVVDMIMTEQDVCAPLICPALLHCVLSLLPKPWNLKVSTDGKFRLLFQNYVLISIGVNVKNWSSRKDVRMFAFRSSFVPLAFAICNKENTKAYQTLSAAVLQTANQLGHALAPEHLLQWHGDMHKGIEGARIANAPAARRVTDWAHVTGVTSQGPAGLPGALVKHLPVTQQASVMPLVLQWVRSSKTMTRHLFHVVWGALFEELVGRGLQSVVTVLQRDYFFRADDAWDASWRTAPDCCMPGTGVGSAPQESWHNATLAAECENAGKSPYGLAEQLSQRVVRKLLEGLRAKEQAGETLQDWPAIGQFVDLHCLKNGPGLAKEGRTSAQELLDWGLHSRFRDSSGNVWMLFPTSRSKVDWVRCQTQKKRKIYKPRVPVQLAPNAAKHFAGLATATSAGQVEDCLDELRIYNKATRTFKCLRTAAKTFDDWRCVLRGPCVRQFWQLHHVALPDAGNNPGSGNPHNCCLCFLCEVCSCWGPCEHMYACLQHEGEINKGSLPEPKKAGRPRKDTRIAAAGQGAALVPGPMLERTTGSTAAASSARAPMPQSGAEDIRDILADAGLGHHFGAFARQKATRAVLADLTYADLHIIFALTLAESHELKAALARSQPQTFLVPFYLRTQPRDLPSEPLYPCSVVLCAAISKIT
eukprot:s647_g10.t1